MLRLLRRRYLDKILNEEYLRLISVKFQGLSSQLVTKMNICAYKSRRDRWLTQKFKQEKPEHCKVEYVKIEN